MTTHIATRKGRDVVHSYYVCNRHKANGKGACPYARYHKAEELEHRVERVILDLIRRPEIMLEQIEREIESREQAASSAARDAAMYQEQLRRIEQKRSGFQDMAAEGLITFAELRSKLDALQREGERSQEALEALTEPERVAKELSEIPARVEDYIAELPQLIHEDPERRSEYLKDIYRKLSLSVIAHKDDTLTISGAFGNRELEPHDPGPFIGIKATYDLDSEAYTWTEIPPPDSEFWDTWKEGDPVIWVRRKSPSSRWVTRAARPAATCTTGV
jgi:hypothetical protein